MPTKNPRINVALEKPIYSLIERMAQERGLSLSMVTRDLDRETLRSMRMLCLSASRMSALRHWPVAKP